MKDNINEVFKYEMYHAKLNLDLDDLQKFSFNLQKNNKGRVRSNIGGWQSNNLPETDYEEYKNINKLKNEILKHLDIFSKNFNINKKLTLSNLWININGYKDSHMVHLHPNSILSGVFYIKTPKNSGSLSFHNPCEDFAEGIFKGNVSSYNTKNCSIWYFEPQENMLFLFPSFLKHSVGPNMNKTEKRIALSFNSTWVQ
jgi:uncharacterized protein (TIGR02466 family)|tara:strand:+ start:160 stop:756 length:597 start_codon:yes stop_codon:yes gene_type:complete